MNTECPLHRDMLFEEISKFGISDVEFCNLDGTYSKIINRVTCSLEKRLTVFLKQVIFKLYEYSRKHDVKSSLVEVNAILRRLKQAACYPECLSEAHEEGELVNDDVKVFIQRFEI